MASFLTACLAVTAICLPRGTLATEHKASVTSSMTDAINISEWPDICDTQQLSSECMQALGSSGGASIYYPKDHGCSKEQQYKLKLGFEGAQDLLSRAAEWPRDGSTRDIISVDYRMGPDWREQKDRIQSNLQRANNFTNDHAWSGTFVYLHCNDLNNTCHDSLSDTGKSAGGYAWNERHWYWWNPRYHINMCDPYYTSCSMDERMSHVNGWRRDRRKKMLQRMENYHTFGQFIAHELMHLESTFKPEPAIIDKRLPQEPFHIAYGPQRIWKLAHGGRTQQEGYGAASSSINADSYTMFVNSMFWWTLAEEFPEAPGKPVDGPAAMPLIFINSSEVDINDADQFKHLMEPYFVDDPDDTVEHSYPVSLQDINTCHGVSGDYWMRSRDVAVDNANDFCQQSDRSKTYNTGSVNELVFTVKKVGDDSKGPKDDPNCLARLTNGVIDGCDNDDRINNPHNYKFGSTLGTIDDWQYTMKPLSKQVVDVNCDVSYKFFFDSFEIRGKNLPDAMLGPDGEGLQHQLFGCGVLTSWQFEFTPDACCFQWYASGRLPIGTKKCIGDALMAAGGNNNGHCHGPGKRSNYGKRASISSWPGYGDDGKHVFGKQHYHNITITHHNSTFTAYNTSVRTHNMSILTSNRRYSTTVM